MPNHPKKPRGFLGVPDTVYPVTIDPTLEVSDNLNGAGAIEDSVIYSGTQLTYTYNDLCAHNSVHNGLYYVWEDVVVFKVDGYDNVIDPD